MSLLSPLERPYVELGAFVTRHPRLRDLADRNRPNRILPLGFRVARTRAHELRDAPTFRGDSNVTRERARWPVGVIAVDTDRMWRELRRPNRRGAEYVGVFTIGRFALDAILPWELRPQQGGGEQLFGARVGPNDMQLAIAVGLSDGSLVVPPGSIRVLQAVQDAEGRYLPQHSGGVDDVPDGVMLY